MPEATGPLTAAESLRYARHLMLPEIGAEGQQRLREASVLLVGVGGLGSPVALYLAAAGVGRIGIVDDDQVEVTNLQRQVLYGEKDLGRSKVDAARARLQDLNPHIDIEVHDVRLDATNALDLVSRHDVVVDGSDNFATRYLVNDACVLARRPNVHGSIFRFEGQASVFAADGGPCYRCLFARPPPPGTIPSCAEAGVLGVLPGIMGSIQATEAIKVITGIGETLAGRLLLFDALQMRFDELRVRRDPKCAACGDTPTITSVTSEADFCEDVSRPVSHGLAAAELASWVQERGDVLLLDVREPFERSLGTLPDAVNIPLGELQERLDEVPRGRDVVAFCQSGNRSARAVEILRASGFEARHLSGGITAWNVVLGQRKGRR